MYISLISDRYGFICTTYVLKSSQMTICICPKSPWTSLSKTKVPTGRSTMRFAVHRLLICRCFCNLFCYLLTFAANRSAICR